MTNNQPQTPVTEEQVFAYIGRLTMENQMLRQQLALLQQQIAQGQQAEVNGKEPEETPEVAGKAKK